MKKNTLKHIKTSGFKTPKDYFSTVEEQILNEVSLKAKVDQSGFEIPEKYFNSLDDNILNRLEKETPVIQIKSRKISYYIVGIAASLILMFNLFYISKTPSISTIETASLENYLEEGDYTSYELASLLTEEELNALNLINSEISTDSIEDYLLDNSEIEDLIIE